MRWWRLLGFRVLWMIPVVLGVVTLTFVLVHVLSPDPTSLLVSPYASAAVRAKLRSSLGLSQPLYVQYLKFLWNLLHGNLGISFVTGRTVTSDLLIRLPATAELATYAVVTGVVGGVLVGVLSAVWRDRWLDLVIRALTLGGLAMPQFWVGLLLLWLFFVKFQILPGPIGRLPTGVTPPHTITGFYLVDSLLERRFELAWISFRQLVLPVFTLGFNIFAPITGVTRSAMIEILETDYIRTAVAMGHGKVRIWFTYALKNALLPVITMVGNSIGFAFSGAVLVEGIFGWPGVGQYALNAIRQSDFPAVQGFVLYSGVLCVVTYLFVDAFYLWVDPRMRT
jgi:ABC-type dipeptide/oligopeptide/nickel transport system permease component